MHVYSSLDEFKRFIREQGEKPWFLHLSFIKPHWPYMVPAPYHRLFGPEVPHRRRAHGTWCSRSA